MKDREAATAAALEWVSHARTFIATGKGELLKRAEETCPDSSVRDFLRCPELANDNLNPKDLAGLDNKLKAHGRVGDARNRSGCEVGETSLAVECSVVCKV